MWRRYDNEHGARDKGQGEVRGGAQILRLANFTGGEAFVFPLTAMNPKYSLLMQNCYVSERGTVAKVPGYTKVNATSCGVILTSGFEFRKTDGSIQLLAAGGGKIFKLSAGSLVEIYTGLDTSAKVNFSSIGNTCVITNGVNAPLKYDGTTVSALGGTPPATTFKTHVHKGRVWFIERTNKLLASHSALNNPESQEGYIDFQYALKKGDELVDIFTYIDLLVFLFKNHIAIYSGQTPSGTGADFKLVQLIDGAGAMITNVVQGLGTDCGFLSQNGIKTLKQIVTTGTLNTGNISTLIDPYLLKKIAEGGDFASAHYPKLGWYLLKVGSIIFVYSYVYKAWSRITGADCSGMFATADGKLYFCGNGFLYEYGSGGTFAGVNPIMQWDTAWIQLSKAGNKASLKLAEILAYSDKETTINLSYAYDVAPMDINIMQQFTGIIVDDVTDWDAIPQIDSLVPPEPVRVPLFGRGRVMQMRFKNQSDAAVEIADIILQLVQGGI